jgi:hypothetical protein
VLRNDLDLLERLQRRYTKTMRDMHNPLRSLSAMSLEDRRDFADTVTVFTALHGFANLLI